MSYAEKPADRGGLRRGTFLKMGAAGAGALALGATGQAVVPDLKKRGLFSANGVFDASSTALADLIYIEAFPTSPLILNPFSDYLLIPPAMSPVPDTIYTQWARGPSATGGPGFGLGEQNSFGNDTHQIPPKFGPTPNVSDLKVYQIKLEVNTHKFTNSKVRPITNKGRPAPWFNTSGVQQPPAGPDGVYLPPSTIYGFNGTFPGPRLNAEYGKPVLVRFDNPLDENRMNLDRQDFGSPADTGFMFLTHLHNGHTAPESDGQPHYSMTRGPLAPGYAAGTFVDNLYLNWPAGGDSREKQ